MDAAARRIAITRSGSAQSSRAISCAVPEKARELIGTARLKCIFAVAAAPKAIPQARLLNAKPAV
jgi:hypothetical protein